MVALAGELIIMSEAVLGSSPESGGYDVCLLVLQSVFQKEITRSRSCESDRVGGGGGGGRARERERERGREREGERESETGRGCMPGRACTWRF